MTRTESGYDVASYLIYNKGKDYGKPSVRRNGVSSHQRSFVFPSSFKFAIVIL